MFMHYAIHYPKPGMEDLLAESMTRFGKLVAEQPGLIFIAPTPFRDAEGATLMGISIWESEADFNAALPVLRAHREKHPSQDWEMKPAENYLRYTVR